MRSFYVLAAALLVSAVPASAQIIDFDGVATPLQVNYVPTPYSEDGFQIACSNGGGAGGACLYDFATFGPLDTRWVGSPALFSPDAIARATLTKIGGGTFGISSIDVANLNGGPGPVTVIFYGLLSGGGIVSQSFTVPGGDPALATYSFSSSFGQVESVYWNQVDPYYQFDNIVLNATTVPEPGTLLLLATGLTALAGGRWRRRRA